MANPNNGIVEQGAGPGGLGAIMSPDGADLTATQGPRIIATCAVLMILSTTAVALRFISRYLSKVGLWWDDWTILMAMLLSWGACLSMIVAATSHGFGMHAAAIPLLTDRIFAAQSWFKIFYVYETMYTISIALTKYSILLFYSRIFTERSFRIALRVSFVLVTLWLVSIEITVLAECQPISGLWDFTQAARCIDLQEFFVGSGVPNVLLNVLIVGLPIPMIWTLEIDRKYRWALSGVFALGTFVIAVSIARVVVLSQIQEADITWTFVDPGIWTSVEPSIAVVSACLPILRSLWVWKRNRPSRNTNTLKTASRSPIQSLKPFPRQSEKRRTGSFTSRYPINELPGDSIQGWGVHTEIYSTRGSHSRKMSDNDDDNNISLSDLPIQKQDRTSLDKEPIKPMPRSDIKHVYKKPETPHDKNIAELHG